MSVPKIELKNNRAFKMVIDQDSRLMLQVAEGNTEAFSKLFRKYFPVVIAYLASLDAHQNLLENIAQEVFVRIWEHRTRYRPESLFKTYLFSIAKNVLSEEKKHLLKQAKIRHERFFDHDRHSIDISSDPDATIRRGELLKAVRKAISSMPNSQRQAIKFFYIDGASLAEGATRAKCSIKAFENRLFRARKQLRQLLSSLKS